MFVPGTVIAGTDAVQGIADMISNVTSAANETMALGEEPWKLRIREASSATLVFYQSKETACKTGTLMKIRLFLCFCVMCNYISGVTAKELVTGNTKSVLKHEKQIIIIGYRIQRDYFNTVLYYIILYKLSSKAYDNRYDVKIR